MTSSKAPRREYRSMIKVVLLLDPVNFVQQENLFLLCGLQKRKREFVAEGDGRIDDQQDQIDVCQGGAHRFHHSFVHAMNRFVDAWRV
jgi:hypothetical protein